MRRPTLASRAHRTHRSNWARHIGAPTRRIPARLERKPCVRRAVPATMRPTTSHLSTGTPGPIHRSTPCFLSSRIRRGSANASCPLLCPRICRFPKCPSAHHRTLFGARWNRHSGRCGDRGWGFIHPPLRAHSRPHRSVAVDLFLRTELAAAFQQARRLAWLRPRWPTTPSVHGT